MGPTIALVVLGLVVLLISVPPTKAIRVVRQDQAGPEQGVATEQVDAHDGRITFRGEAWSARTFRPSQVIAAGKNVGVLQIDGTSALVYESEL